LSNQAVYYNFTRDIAGTRNRSFSQTD